MYEIWHDNDFDLAHWLYLNSYLINHEVVFRQIPKTNHPKDLLNHLKDETDLPVLSAIKYDTPDIIILHKSNSKMTKIILIIEFMTHVPQHHHPLQRFSRIYGSAWLGIPSILVIPNQKEKLEKGQKDLYKPTMYKANPLIHHLFIKTNYITGTPTFLLMWPESNGYLKYDKKHPTSPAIEEEIKTIFTILNRLTNDEEIADIRDLHVKKQENESNYNPKGNDYKITTGKKTKTEEIINLFKPSLNLKIEKKLGINSETYLFFPGGFGKKFRTDPYAGMTCAYDILFCRDDSGVRTTNLIIQASGVRSISKQGPTLANKPHEEADCPFINPRTLSLAQQHFSQFCPYTMTKQQRIYGTIPDLIVFDDGGIYVK